MRREVAAEVQILVHAWRYFALLIGNHSSILAYDGMMVAVAMLLDADPPRRMQRDRDLARLVKLSGELGAELLAEAAAKTAPDTFLEVHVTPSRAIVSSRPATAEASASIPS